MYYSPILFSQVADVNLTQFHDCNYDMESINTKNKIIVFALHSMGYLNKLIPFMDKVNKPWILISAMEDTQLPLEIDNNFMNKIKTNHFFRHWFSINKTIPNDKYFTSIPYGLNYWTLLKQPYFGENIQNFETQNNSLVHIVNKYKPLLNRIPKIFCNFHFNLTDERHGGSRRKLLNILPKNITFYQTQQLKRTDSWKLMSEYIFVVSPFGHGFDCIRTFEALSLGCIVIMKKSFLDIIYEDLPILLVDNWEDINEKLLENYLLEYPNKKFNYDKLKFEYWANLVNSKF
jgi:hypothetical protein|tara:strand:+ start:200 stop:1066 length:867 start_codon:yes stop_codon:yes gene_type:complete